MPRTLTSRDEAAVNNLRQYLRANPGKIPQAAEYLGRTPSSMTQWVDGKAGNKSLEQTLLMEGFLRSIGAMEPFSEPTDLMDGLMQAIARRVFSFADLVQFCESQDQTVLRWLKGGPTSIYNQMKLEWLLERHGVMEPVLLSVHGPELRALANAVFSGQTTLEEAAQALEMKHDTLRRIFIQEWTPKRSVLDSVGAYVAKLELSRREECPDTHQLTASSSPYLPTAVSTFLGNVEEMLPSALAATAAMLKLFFQQNKGLNDQELSRRLQLIRTAAGPSVLELENYLGAFHDGEVLRTVRKELNE